MSDKNVTLPNGKTLAFPTDATNEEMNTAVSSYFPELYLPNQPIGEQAIGYEAGEKEPKQPPVGQVFGRSWDNLEKLTGRFIEVTGEALDSPRVIDYGKKIIAANQKEIEEWDASMPPLMKFGDIKGVGLSSSNERGAWDYLQQGMANVLPYIIAGIPAGIAGAATAKFWVPSAGRFLAQKGMGSIGKYIAKKITTPKRSQALGAAAFQFLPSFVFLSGETQDEVKERDPNASDPLTVFKTGALGAALDTVALAPLVLGGISRFGTQPVLKALSKGAGKDVAQGTVATALNAVNKVAATRLGRIPMLGITQGASEGFTERLQEMLIMNAGLDVTGVPISAEERAERLLESTAQGFFVGAGFGSAGGAFGSRPTAPIDIDRTGQDPQLEMFNAEEVGLGKEPLVDIDGVADPTPEPERNEQEIFAQAIDDGQLDLFNIDTERKTDPETGEILENNLPNTLDQDLKDPTVLFRIEERTNQLFGWNTWQDEVISNKDIETIFSEDTVGGEKIIATLLNNGTLEEIATKNGQRQFIVGPQSRSEINSGVVNPIESAKLKFGKNVKVPEKPQSKKDPAPKKLFEESEAAFRLRTQGDKPQSAQAEYKQKDFKKVTAPNATAELPNRITVAGVPAAKMDTSKKDNGIEIEVDGDTYRLIREKKYSISRKADGSPTSRFGKIMPGASNNYLYVNGKKVMMKDNPDIPQGFGRADTRNGINIINQMINKKRQGAPASVESQEGSQEAVAIRRDALAGKPILSKEEVKKIKKLETDLDRMSRGQSVPKYESTNQKLFSGSMLLEKNRAELLEALNGDQRQVDNFIKDMKLMSDTMRLAGGIASDGTVNQSKADRIANDVLNFDINSPSGLRGHMARVGMYDYIMASMSQIATKYPAFSPVFKGLVKYNEIQKTIQSNFNNYYRGIGSLSKEDNRTVKRFITVANILGDDPNAQFKIAEDGQSASILFPVDYEVKIGKRILKGQQAVDFRLGYLNEIGNPNYITPGQPVTLNNKETVAAFTMLRRGLQQSFLERLEAMVRYLDVPGEVPMYDSIVKEWSASKEGIVDLDKVPNLGELIISRGEGLTDQTKSEEMIKFGEYIRDAQDRSLTNYFPNVRQGDGIFRIVYTNEKGVRETVWRTDIVIPFYKGNRQTYAIGWAEKNLPSQLFEDFPLKDSLDAKAEGYSYEYADNKQVASEGEFNGHEVMEAMILSADETNRKAKGKDGAETFRADFKEAIENIKLQKQKRGVEGHFTLRSGVPGHITPVNFASYHDQAYAIYQSKVARYVARIRTEKNILNELDILKKAAVRIAPLRKIPGTGNLYDVASKLKDFTFSPQSSAQQLKAVAFYGFLGGNPSSILVNLFQSGVTGIVLTSVYGASAVPAITKAFYQAAKFAATVGVNKRGMYAPSLDSNEPYIKEQAETIYAKLRRRNIVRDRGEYQMLSQLIDKGVIGKINTEALSENSDVSAEFFVEKLGINKNNKTANSILKAGLGFGKAMATMYATGEITNRVAAALATYRLAKKKGVSNLNKFNASEVANSSLVDTEQGYTDAAESVTTMTQFSLDAYNRPMISRLAGGVPIQFLPFVQMMIEIYSNSIMGRYGGEKALGTVETFWTDDEIIQLSNSGVDIIKMGISAGDVKEVGRTSMSSGTIDNILGVPIPTIDNKMGASMVIGMVTYQMLLGGIWGQPYADDVNEVIKLLSKILGMPVTDVRMEVVNYLNEAEVDPAIVDVITKGALTTATGVSFTNRLSLNMLSNFLRNRDNPAVLIGGPAASFLEGYIGRIKKYTNPNDPNFNPIKAGLAMVPSGLTTNLVKSWDQYEQGAKTMSGNPLTAPGSVRDTALKLLGFSTTNVVESREALMKKTYLLNKSKARSKALGTQLADMFSNYYIAYDQEKGDKADRIYAAIQEKIKKMNDWDQSIIDGTTDGIVNVENMLDPNGTLVKNAMEKAQKFVLIKTGRADPSILTATPRGFEGRYAEVMRNEALKSWYK